MPRPQSRPYHCGYERSLRPCLAPPIAPRRRALNPERVPLTAIHPGARAFALTADAYERARPTYPAAAIDWVLESGSLGAGDPVVDLAAGTGKLTRLLVERGLSVIAVEPVAEMRAVLERSVPGAEVRKGTAEAIPVGDGEARAVTVAQAFHWFDQQRAMPEIARVLDHGGVLATLANIRDKSDPLQADLEELIGGYRGAYPNPNWPETLADDPLFTSELRTFAHEVLLDEETFVERVASVSWIASLPADERDRVLASARELVAGSDEVRMPYVTEVYICRRR
jgi:SAM-dependent methyltransferase